MRHINLEELRPLLPHNWERRARRALNTIRNLPPDQRPEAINRRAPLWQELNGALSSLSAGKCWYCESREKRSDNPVDHFRPKNRVVECPAHEGYWWLAFNWLNYRFGCTYCNSYRKGESGGSGGGKHDHFPLLDEASRAYGEADDLTSEDPELLDPTEEADPILLWFSDDGRAVARFAEQTHPVLHGRATTSIRLYHLNHVLSVEARKNLSNEIRNLVEDGNLYFHEWVAGNRAAKRGCHSVIAQLRQKLDKTAEYSAAARAILLGLRDSDHPWLDSVISAA